MKTQDLKWSKTRAQCPYCGDWYTKQGILGHIRFRHPDKKKKETDVMQDMLKEQFYDIYLKAEKTFRDQGRLTPQYRTT